MTLHDQPIDPQYEAAWLELSSNRTERVTRICTEWLWDHVFRLRVAGIENIPLTGPVIFAANHASYIDPFVHARALPRSARFLTKSQLIEAPIIGRIVQGGGGYPIRRGKQDVQALVLTVKMLERGQAIIMYPEGTRFRTHVELGTPRSGIARVALAVGATVIPVASWGTKPRAARHDGASRFALPAVTTVYGKPVVFVKHEDPEISHVHEVRDEIWAGVTAAYDQAHKLACAKPRGGSRPKAALRLAGLR